MPYPICTQFFVSLIHFVVQFISILLISTLFLSLHLPRSHFIQFFFPSLHCPLFHLIHFYSTFIYVHEPQSFHYYDHIFQISYLHQSDNNHFTLIHPAAPVFWTSPPWSTPLTWTILTFPRTSSHSSLTYLYSTPTHLYLLARTRMPFTYLFPPFLTL